jgi:DnaJ-domain-containing protein 1
VADTARLPAGRTLRAFLVVSDMEEDIVRRLREQERMLGEMRDNVLGWMDDLLRDAFNPESFLRYVAGMGIDLSQVPNLVGRRDGFDPYRVLGLDKTATDEEVKKRYRELLIKLHPDTAGVRGTDFLLQMMIAAYQQITKERRWK